MNYLNKNIIFFAVFIATVILMSSTALADIVVRKNIDDLSADELKAYKHALQLLVDRSSKNVYDSEGFLWQAWVHNCASLTVPNNGDKSLEEQVWPPEMTCKLDDVAKSGVQNWKEKYETQKAKTKQDGSYKNEMGYPGQCQHHSDVFFPWHRAQFYYFEKLLQLTDPDGTIKDSTGVAVSTRNVAVPYWDFTKPPSGERYPKVFEDEHSILWAPGRNKGKLTAKNMPNYTSPELIAHFIKSSWKRFGGLPNGDQRPKFHSDGPGNEIWVLGEGLFETSVHDNMHDHYVGGYLASPDTAGLDPIFYSFHAYIDLIYEEWLEYNGTREVTSYQRVLRSVQPDIIPNPPGWPGFSKDIIDQNARQDMGRGEIYFDTSAVGYMYEVGFDDREALQASAKNKLKNSKFGSSKQSPLTQLMLGRSGAAGQTLLITKHSDLDLANADKDIHGWIATMPRKPLANDYSYRQQIYIHPKSVTNELGRELRSKKNGPLMDKYFANDSSYWQMGNHKHVTQNMTSMALNANVSKVVDALKVHIKSGEEWTMSVVIFSHDEDARATDFGMPALNPLKKK